MRRGIEPSRPLADPCRNGGPLVQSLKQRFVRYGDRLPAPPVSVCCRSTSPAVGLQERCDRSVARAASDGSRRCQEPGFGRARLAQVPARSRRLARRGSICLGGAAAYADHLTLSRGRSHHAAWLLRTDVRFLGSAGASLRWKSKAKQPAQRTKLRVVWRWQAFAGDRSQAPPGRVARRRLAVRSDRDRVVAIPWSQPSYRAHPLPALTCSPERWGLPIAAAGIAGAVMEVTGCQSIGNKSGWSRPEAAPARSGANSAVDFE